MHDSPKKVTIQFYVVYQSCLQIATKKRFESRARAQWMSVWCFRLCHVSGLAIQTCEERFVWPLRELLLELPLRELLLLPLRELLLLPLLELLEILELSSLSLCELLLLLTLALCEGVMVRVEALC